MFDSPVAVNLDSSDGPADLNNRLKCNFAAHHAAEGCVLAKSSSVKGGPAWSPNHLYFGDNIDWLEKLEPESVDLVYLDPPFNSKAQYNVIYETPDEKRGTAQAKVFRDSWTWEDEATDCFNRVLARGGKVASIVNAMANSFERNDTMAYVVMMAARLSLIRDVMKSTGSLYLHCDPTASHYLKLVLDGLFGDQNFRNEIIWKRTGSHGGSKRWGPVHDTILFYTKSTNYTWNRVFQEYDKSYLDNFYRFNDDRGRYRLVTLSGAGIRSGDSGKPWRNVDPTTAGRHWAVPARALAAAYPGKDLAGLTTQEKLDLLDMAGLIYWPPRGSVPQQKRYSDENPGVQVQDIITDIGPISSQSKERLGFPTQKPVSLLRRIIEASTNEGETVLDPFCGCGTTVYAAADMKRNWIGIDVSYYGTRLVQRRIVENFGEDYPLEVSGIPADFVSAEALAERDQYGFQQWAVGELNCQLWNDGKKGADGGIDGEMWFYAGPTAPGRLLVQVKGGRKIGVGAVREFKTVLKDNDAQMGVFFCRSDTTQEMRTAAAELGKFKIGSVTYNRLQLITLSDWVAGRRPPLPVPIPINIPQDKSKPRKLDRRDKTQTELLFSFDGLSPREGQIFNPTVLPRGALKLTA
jgi:site-specific DNA-methyltransferase (adenine-specific)